MEALDAATMQDEFVGPFRRAAGVLRSIREREECQGGPGVDPVLTETIWSLERVVDAAKESVETFMTASDNRGITDIVAYCEYLEWMCGVLESLLPDLKYRIEMLEAMHAGNRSDEARAARQAALANCPNCPAEGSLVLASEHELGTTWTCSECGESTTRYVCPNCQNEGTLVEEDDDSGRPSLVCNSCGHSQPKAPAAS